MSESIASQVAERTRQIRNSSYRNRKRQKAKHKNNQGDHANNNARPAERLHLLRLRMTNAEHDSQQQNENKPCRAVVPDPAQNRNCNNGNEHSPANPLMSG